MVSLPLFALFAICLWISVSKGKGTMFCALLGVALGMTAASTQIGQAFLSVISAAVTGGSAVISSAGG